MATKQKTEPEERASFARLEGSHQDHLYYALDWARSAEREYYLLTFGEFAPRKFEGSSHLGV
jgi:hypothetical protein